MTDMEQQQKEVRKKALKLLEHMDRTEKGLYCRKPHAISSQMFCRTEAQPYNY